MEPSILTILQGGGYAMVVIALCSVATIAVGIERFAALWGFAARARALASEVIVALLRGDLEGARAACTRSRSPAGEVFLAALRAASLRGRAGHDDEASALARAAAALERARQEVNLELRRRLWVLGTVGAIAPFVGLFGTVVGIMNAFRHMAVTGQGGFVVVASGISEALIATAGGIGVAIAAVVLYNALNVHVQRLSVTLRLLSEEVLEALGAGLAAEAKPAGGGARPAASKEA